MNWKKLLKILGLLLFLILLGFWLRSDFWQVKRVDCQFNQLNCNAEIWNKISDLSLKRNIIFFPRQLVTNKIKENYPQVHLVKIKKRLPNKLSFDLTSRKPIAVLSKELFPEPEATLSAQIESPKFSSTGLYYLLDEEGVVTQKLNENQNLPLILIKEDPQFKIGEKVNSQEIKKTIEILVGMKLRLLEPKVSRVISFREIEIWLGNETLAIFNGQKDVGVQLDSLQFIFSRSKIEGKQVKKIDLRFDKPLIVD
jgi:hypothetical protein